MTFLGQKITELLAQDLYKVLNIRLMVLYVTREVPHNSSNDLGALSPLIMLVLSVELTPVRIGGGFNLGQCKCPILDSSPLNM